MQYTENYELPIIEGTDVPNYAPYNECANKVDTAMKSISDDTEQAVAQVQTLKTEIEHEMDEFTNNIEEEFAQTKEEINQSVNEKLAVAPKYFILYSGNDTSGNYDFGAQAGTTKFPLYEINKAIDKNSIEMKVNERNNLVLKTSSRQDTCIINFNMSVEATGIPVTITLKEVNPYGTDVVVASQTSAMQDVSAIPVENPKQTISFSTIANLSGYQRNYYIEITSSTIVTLNGDWNLSIVSAMSKLY